MEFGTVIINKGTAFLKLKNCAIPTLVITSDGLEVVQFKGNKTPHIKVDVVIKWHEEELKYNKAKYTKGERDKYIKTLENNLTELYNLVKELND